MPRSKLTALPRIFCNLPARTYPRSPTAWKGIYTKRWGSAGVPPALSGADTAALLFRQLVSRKKETQFKARRVFGIGAMNRIVLDARRPLLADRAFLGVGRIGGAHQLAQVGNGVFLFQSQSDDWSARHEIGERVIERPARMHGVKLLRLILGDFQHLHGENVESVLLELLDDVTDRVLGDGVRFHNGKSALQGFHSGG